MRVRVYRNLHRNCWSIQHKTPRGWRVLRHATAIILAEVRYIVSQSGRNRVLRERKKYVHAYIEGILQADFNRRDNDYLQEAKFTGVIAKVPALRCLVQYNPYLFTHFSYIDGTPAAVGATVLLTRYMDVWETKQEVENEAS